MTKKVFVTGIGSFVGQHLVQAAEVSGFELVGVDINPPSDSRFIDADIRDRDLHNKIPKEVDAVIHLAALSRDPDCRNRGYECFDVNVQGTLNVLDATEKSGAKQLIFASSEWVYSHFDDNQPASETDVIDAASLDSEYALSKYVSEQNLRQKHNHGYCPISVLRFGIIYAERKNNWSAVEALVNTTRENDVVTVGSKATARGFIHVSDICSGILSAVGLPGYEVINLQGPATVTLGEIVSSAAKYLDKEVEIKESSPDTPSVRNVSGAKAAKLLGWSPKITVDEGVARLVKYFSA